MSDTSVPLVDMARAAVRKMSDDEKIKFVIEVCLDVADPTAARPALTFVSERVAQHKRIQSIVDRHENNLLVTGNPKDNDCVWLRSARTGTCAKTEGHRAAGSMQPAAAPTPEAPLYDARMMLAEEVLLRHRRRQLNLLRNQLHAVRSECAQDVPLVDYPLDQARPCALQQYGSGGTPVFCTGCRQTVSVSLPRCGQRVQPTPEISRSDNQ